MLLPRKRYLWPIVGLLVLFFPFFFFHMHGHKLENGDVEDQMVKLQARPKKQASAIVRMDDDQHYTDLFKDFEVGNEARAVYSHPHVEFGAPQCGCAAGEVFGRMGILGPSNMTVVQAKKPKRRFHSNHWFHIGEYFLSQHQNPEVTGVIRSGDTIMFMANEVKFVNKLTFSAAFFILLALSSGEGCSDGSIRETRLEFYEPSYIYKRSQVPSVEWGSFSSYGPSVVLDMSKAPGQQFQRIDLLGHVQEEINTGRQCHCGKLIRSIGYHPTPSKQWFRTPMETREFRDKIKSFCLADEDAGTNALSTLYSRKQSSQAFDKSFVMTVYERDSNRHFAGLELMLAELDEKLDPTWTLGTIKHSEDLQPCKLYRELHKTDVFLTTHGFQSTALVFLREGSVIIEVYPYKYWKPSYLPLAAQFGVHHRWTQNHNPTSPSRLSLRLISQEWCMSINKCRSHARGDSVTMPPDHIDLVISVAKAKEMGKLGAISPSLSDGI